MFKDVLTDKQNRLLGLIKKFQQEFYLAGGTAIALQIGHRRSIDFDLFSKDPLNTMKIIRTIKRNSRRIDATLEESVEELTMIIEGVKITFLEYPFDINPSINLDDIISMPDLLTLTAMKAYSLGRRSKWKDYIDLYFIFRDYFTIRDVSKKAKEIFGGGFNERLFREQLCYFEGIDFSETIEYVREVVGDETIKGFLTSISIEL
jgi:hypothetical protein